MDSQTLDHVGPVLRLSTATSTNDVAAELARQGAADGTVVVADRQTAGRGRRGRVWLAPPRSSLLCSLIVRPSLKPAQAARLTMLASVATQRAIRAMGLPAVIKWPNDVLINERKVAGILTETDILGDQLSFAVIGIGVNVNIPPADLPAVATGATSLLAEGGRRFSRWRLLRLLLAAFAARYQAMAADDGAALFQEWRQNLSTLGQAVTIRTADVEMAGVAEDVEPDGTLLLRQKGDALARVTVGDVS